SALVETRTIVRFNRPFLMIIVDHFTWSIFFMSKVTNPKQA
nr:Chain B, Alpha-1-antichymotrypsin [Homo sapiens]6HGG_B Chain B, Alpha-1-antichymotrypsin [Homo sapiens]6HGH_B Chain B, Alpha-1-antichymotrypsin [Homo sapiens]6HGI_B Chain B, Alpha-1-antichymotrypsin [Homo sapiens]6HGJ_B Chain B, Alpha-1-antichymotrypsin [Homo sapiens]6HGK_B Chain B, Alpha-1-antichymotrypsin [Homo sapiens]6HGL_B Chain B, Alpha-1-antichymotrypsin [Homo sapiens]6HGM_B Chain B, Alpha-1-antichymotrypsin [Homo sapiens]